MLNVNVTTNNAASPALEKLLAGLTGEQRKAMLAGLGKRVEQELQEHFRRKNSRPNKKGWPKQNFWAGVRDATSYTGATVERATVTIAHPAIRIKIYGGTITPKGGRRALAIPLTAAAYVADAHGAREKEAKFPGLFMLKRPGKNPLLCQPDPTRPGAVIPQYVLVSRVRHPADPTALPPRRDLNRVLLKSARRRLDRIIRQTN